METQKIKAILSALQYGSLSKAAEVISYTPSAMSHIADSLEKELGVKILERSPLGISLTPEGEALYAHMTAMVEAEKRLRTAAEEIVNARENHLRIGAFSSISQHLLPEVIGQFKREHPEIRISLSVDDKLQDWLEKGLADVIFTDEFTYGDNLWVPIKEDPFVAVVPSGILNGKRSVTREELYPYTYISINEQILHSYFDRERFAGVLDFASIDNVSVLYMVKQGLGFSILPSLIAGQRLQGVRTLRLLPSISRTIGFACKKGERLSHATQVFMEYLTKAKRSHREK